MLFVCIIFAVPTGDLARGPTIATCGPPLALLVVVVAFLAEVAVLGRVIGEAEREWWARLSAWLLMSAVAWATFFGCLLFVPALLIWFDSRYVNTGILAGWIVTTVGGVRAGRSRADQGWQRPSRARVAGCHRPACLPGRPVYGSLAAGRFPGERSRAPLRWSTDQGVARNLLERNRQRRAGRSLFLWMAGSFGFSWLMGRVVEVNLFSLNNMYANRLIRCYLGASRPKAQLAEALGRRNLGPRRRWRSDRLTWLGQTTEPSHGIRP